VAVGLDDQALDLVQERRVAHQELLEGARRHPVEQTQEALAGGGYFATLPASAIASAGGSRSWYTWGFRTQMKGRLR
jgi:hypothetical protein